MPRTKNKISEDESGFPIVGIGSSAGGLEATEALLHRLSAVRMAYVVIQHLAPGHESLLADILARATPLRVFTAQDGAVVEASHIYVAPPGVDIVIDGGKLRLSPSTEGGPRYTIDRFFRSLAADRQGLAIGVVLSGAGSDGTLGLRAIAEAGGITFAQEPQTATYPSMPQSAIAAGCVDLCLAPSEIGDELMRLCAHPFVARKRPARLLGRDTRARILRRLQQRFGVDFTDYKWNTIDRRIERRMALQNLDRDDDYARVVETDDDELKVLYADLLIGVTAFFRDREPFELLKSVVFPRLFERRAADRPVRIWVAGAATGEEAYSIAICLLEWLAERKHKTKVQIFASDIDEDALARARLGIYSKDIEVDVSAERLQRYFSRHDRGYRIAQHVRDMIIFAQHNLGHDPPFSRLDLVTCRNVLIYMQPPLQRRILSLFHYALVPAGFLMLGTSESIGDGSDLFQLVERKLKIYQKKEASSAAVFHFSVGTQADTPQTALKPALPIALARPTMTLQQLADRKIIERYGPPSVVIDDRLDIVQFRGSMGPFLDPRPGTATLNLLHLVRPELILELRATIQKAQEGGHPNTSEPVRLLEQPGRSVVVDALPLADLEHGRRGLLVSFREVAPPAPPPAPADAPAQEPDTWHAHALEQELIRTREYLQTSVQDLQSANEELQSANEELQSTNEELQSTNEELETSKEELQSTNEELSTVNEELQNRMAQLAISNEDLENVLANVSAPIVVVGVDLRIRRFSAAAETLLHLIPADIGRPVASLIGTIKAPVDRIAAEAIEAGRPHQQPITCTDGGDYTMLTSPYRGGNHRVCGAVIEFVQAVTTPPVST